MVICVHISNTKNTNIFNDDYESKSDLESHLKSSSSKGQRLSLQEDTVLLFVHTQIWIFAWNGISQKQWFLMK